MTNSNMRQRLGPAACADLVRELPAWQLAEDGTALLRELRFADFAAAFAFMTQVALRAEALDHHPDWHNVYDRVRIRLTTHDAGGLTELDARLARYIDSIAPA